VLIPAANVEDLMLRDDVLEAVAANKFHVWPVEKIEQGIEILTGMAAGHRNGDGSFERQTVFGLVDHRLAEMAKRLKEFKDFE
jgi:predicted ATP-dependent protease